MTRQESDEERQRGSRRLAIGLALFAAAIFVSFIVRQWMANS